MVLQVEAHRYTPACARVQVTRQPAHGSNLKLRISRDRCPACVVVERREPEATRELTSERSFKSPDSLRQVNANDEPLKRQHSLIGRAIESYFDSATYGGLQTAAVGTVVAVHLARKETPCEVMYMGATEPEYLSIQEVVDSLVAGGSEFEQEDI